MKKILIILLFLTVISTSYAYDQVDVDTFERQLELRGDNQDKVITVFGDFRNYKFQVNLINMTFKAANLGGAQFFGRFHENLIFEDSNLNGAQFLGLRDCVFRRSTLQNVAFSHSPTSGLRDVTFEQCEVDIDFKGVRLLGHIIFDRCEVLDTTNFEGAWLTDYGCNEGVKYGRIEGRWGEENVWPALGGGNSEIWVSADQNAALKYNLRKRFRDRIDGAEFSAIYGGWVKPVQVQAYIDVVLRPWTVWKYGEPTVYDPKDFRDYMAARIIARGGR